MMKTEIELVDIKSAIKQLGKTDERMAEFLTIAPEFNLKVADFSSVYQALIESIISQQLSMKASNCIFKRLCNLCFFNNKIKPLDIIRTGDEELHEIGISKPKITAIRDLTDYEMNGDLPDYNQLLTMSNEDIIRNLTRIRGIGQWTVEMLLIFKLGRKDVFSLTDLGLRKGFAIVQRTYPKLPSIEKMQSHAEKHWKPYRSIASWYLWRACEGL